MSPGELPDDGRSDPMRPHRPSTGPHAPTRSRVSPVAVLGLARSGIALARYLHDQGAR